MPDQARIAGRLAVVCIFTFAVGYATLHVASDLDPVTNWSSDYSLGSGGWIMRLCFMAIAIAAGSAAVGLRAAVSPSRARATAIACFALTALGLTICAFVDTDPPRADGATGYTTHGALHNLASLGSFFLLIVAAFACAAAFAHDDRWRPRSRIARGFGIALVVLMILTLTAWQVGTVGKDGVTGLAQRAFALVAVAGALLLALDLQLKGTAAPDL